MAEGNRHDEIQGEIIHVYDGIEEADNELPVWWLLTFYGAIIFAVGYWFYYHGFGVEPLPMQRYAMERAAAASAGGEVTDELILALADDPSAVASGESAFQTNCAVCHRADAGGNIGPNLTDEYWIHGGSPLAIYDTVKNGVTTAGMPAWGSTLGPTAVQQISAYILTVRNTNVEGKEPEGERWVPGADAAPADEGSEAEATGSEAADEGSEAEAMGDEAAEAAPEATEAAPEAPEASGAPTGTQPEAGSDTAE